MLYMRTVYSFIPCCLIGVADNSDREEGFDRPPSSSSEDSEEDEDLDGSGDNLNNIISKLKTAGKGLFVNGQHRARKKKKRIPASSFGKQLWHFACLKQLFSYLEVFYPGIWNLVYSKYYHDRIK